MRLSESGVYRFVLRQHVILLYFKVKKMAIYRDLAFNWLKMAVWRVLLKASLVDLPLSGRGCVHSEASTERRVGRWGLGRSGTKKDKKTALTTIPTTDRARGNARCSSRSEPPRRAHCTSSSPLRESAHVRLHRSRVDSTSLRQSPSFTRSRP